MARFMMLCFIVVCKSYLLAWLMVEVIVPNRYCSHGFHRINVIFHSTVLVFSGTILTVAVSV